MAVLTTINATVNFKFTISLYRKEHVFLSYLKDYINRPKGRTF